MLENTEEPIRRILRIKGYNCPDCKDMGWLVRGDLQPRQPGFGVPIRCKCKQGIDVIKRRRSLEAMDGLRAAERRMRFEHLVVNDANTRAIEEVEAATIQRRGMITLTGAPGTGKSTLLICAVNAAREANIPAVYTTMTDLLDFLRSGFGMHRQGHLFGAHRGPSSMGSDTEQPDDPVRALNFERRWELLLKAEVLALDELDEFSATDWAMERFQRLIDERWRSMEEQLTLLATNADLRDLPPKVASRLKDGRAKVLGPGARDWRPLRDWEEVEAGLTAPSTTD